MPLFDSASGLQITGGTFIDNAGDININNTQLQLPGQNCDPLQALGLVAAQGPSRELSGVERNGRQGRAVRRLPYDVSHRPQILSSSQDLSRKAPDDGSWSTSATSILSLSNPPSFPFSQPEYDFNFPPLDSLSTTGYFPSAQESTAAYPELFQDSMNSTTFEYSFANPAPMSDTHGYHGQILPSENQPTFEPTLTALVRNPVSSTHIFSEQIQPRFAPSFNPSIMTADVSFDFSPNSDFLAGSLGEPAPAVATNIESNTFSVAGIDHTPWGGLPGPKTSINGGTFIGGNLNHIQRQGESGLHILHHAIAGDAFHNSAERFPQPKCHPETRTEMLENLWNWTRGFYSFGNNDHKDSDSENGEAADIESDDKDPENNSSESDTPHNEIVWLYGPAGAGKSAIAQSLCQKLEGDGCLGGAFFFQRGHPSRGNGNKLFPTLAYQLSRCRPELKHAICQVVEDDPSITDRSLSIQLQRLIIEPCQQNLDAHTLTIVIDGLDECDNQDIQQEILQSIESVMHYSSLPLQFLIASRPEPHIREIFMGMLHELHHPLNVNKSFEDVQKYLLNEFARIHQEHRATMAKVPHPWPSLDIIDKLVDKSSGYFIYASTVIKFIDDKKFRPTERLAVITGMEEPCFGLPFAALDQLYTQILAEVPARPELLKILAVITAKIYLSAVHIEQLLQLEPGDVKLALHGLHSVINLEEEDNTISTHHASFCDFLQDPARAGIFYVGGCQHQTDLSRHILKAFSYKHEDPSRNRCGHVAWCLGLPAFECVASCKTSSDLIAQLRSFNPDFLFDLLERDELISTVLNWLKKSQPLPEDLIQLWEDYKFMDYFEQMWYQDREVEVTWSDRDHCSQILSQASPSLIIILQAIRFIPLGLFNSGHLFRIHFLLDFPWDELRMAICSLRSVIGNEGVMRKLWIVALDHTIFLVHFDLIMLACSSLRVMQHILRDELDIYMMGRLERWSHFLRACPPSHRLLQDLEPILEDYHNDLDEEYHNIVQWLKTFPQPPQELIRHVEGYLQRALQHIRSYHRSFGINIFEEEWRDWYNPIERYRP